MPLAPKPVQPEPAKDSSLQPDSTRSQPLATKSATGKDSAISPGFLIVHTKGPGTLQLLHHPTLSAEGLGLEELFGGPRHVQVFQWKLWHLGLAGEDMYLGGSERRRDFTARVGEPLG